MRIVDDPLDALSGDRVGSEGSIATSGGVIQPSSMDARARGHPAESVAQGVTKGTLQVTAGA